MTQKKEPTKKHEEDRVDEDRVEDELPKKERVLHTRVPAVLDQELKRLAKAWRVPVSNVVRAMLEDAVEAADRVGKRAEGNLHRVVDRIAEQRERFRTMAAEREAGSEPDTESGSAASAPPDDPEAPEDKLDGVIGYQPLVLATATKCTVCDLELHPGEEAYLGVRESPGPRVLIGKECLPKKGNEKEQTS